MGLILRKRKGGGRADLGGVAVVVEGGGAGAGAGGVVREKVCLGRGR